MLIFTSLVDDGSGLEIAAVTYATRSWELCFCL